MCNGVWKGAVQTKGGRRACKCQQGRVGGREGLCVAVCMRCLMECGAVCNIGQQGGHAIGKALKSNSTLQSLDLACELGVGVGQGRGMHLRGMAGGRTHA